MFRTCRVMAILLPLTFCSSALALDFPRPDFEAGSYEGRKFLVPPDHLGDDSAHNHYDPVYAVGDGVVVQSKINSQGYGNVVVIEHTMPGGEIVCSIYGHLCKHAGYPLAALGAQVSEGDVIGYIGQHTCDGCGDDENGDGGEHLHLGIRKGPYNGHYEGYIKSSCQPHCAAENYHNPTTFIEDNPTEAPAWWCTYIDPLHDMGILSHECSYYGGSHKFNRADTAKIVGKAINLDQTTAFDLCLSPFSDVDGDEWYAGYVSALAFLDHGDGTAVFSTEYDEFEPGELMTRCEVTKVVVEAWDLEFPPVSPPALQFSDASEIPDWCMDYVKSAVIAGVITNSAGTFKPKTASSAGETAAIVQKAILNHGQPTPQPGDFDDPSCGPGECEAGYPVGSTKPCGNCGTKTCEPDAIWGTCAGEGVCGPGEKQFQECGNCGEQDKTCDSSCTWGGWSSCSGQGECSPSETKGCGDCGTATCTQQCSWGSCAGGDNGLCGDGLCCTDDFCEVDGKCLSMPMTCQPGWSCQEASCQCVEGCGQFGEDAECQGNVLFWCETGQLKQEDCGPKGGVCVAGEPDECCFPDCEGKECGANGCGAVCGQCDGGMDCVAGACIGCTPDCGGKECGDDGCGGLCGTCATGHYCSEGQCEEGECVPDCDGKECGDDGCSNLCGTCAENKYCVDGQCESPECVAKCDGKLCGDDGCGGSCGECPLEKPLCEQGKCMGSCLPDCASKECGNDGCGGTCGACPDAAPFCVDGTCELPAESEADGGKSSSGCSLHAPDDLSATLLLAMLLLALAWVRRSSHLLGKWPASTSENQPPRWN